MLKDARAVLEDLAVVGRANPGFDPDVRTGVGDHEREVCGDHIPDTLDGKRLFEKRLQAGVLRVDLTHKAEWYVL